jgi:protein O-GlcNAc transferase
MRAMATITEALAIAVEHHQAGRLQIAEEIYRRILAVEPNQPDALHLLGLVAHQVGRHDVAVEFIGRAIELEGSAAAFHNNLGNALMDLGRLDEAVASYQRAMELKPDYAEAHKNLGIALHEQGRLTEAVACYQRALQLKPLAEAHYNLGIALHEQRQLGEAIACYQRALQLRPNLAEAHNNLGNALKDQGLLSESVACYQRALELKPDYAEAHNNLGGAFTDQGKLDEAVACYQRALEQKPDYAEAHNNLGIALKDQGQLAEAVASYRRALQIMPDAADVHSNLLYTLHFCSDYDAPKIYEEHRRWNQRHAEALAARIQPHTNDRSPNRRLRIGYVSPNFRAHPVGCFLLPLLGSHDHADFEIFCYASVRVPDAITERCRACVDVWRNVIGLPDERVADRIRADQIDILVDLTMHMADNRMLVFARKPAPVQVTYLAYCGTTGLDTMDYRLTDSYLDAPNQDERFYSERSIRLPETYWCYQPLFHTPPVSSLPVLQAGHVTFGCLNNFCKVTEPTLAAWSRVLLATPQSRLLLHAHVGSHRDRVRDSLARQGISPDRLTFTGKLPWAEYCGLYGQIDVALDPFPYNGGTTTCDALWMGVPVVSLAGQTAVGRAGLSILSNVALPDLVGCDVEQYVRLAVDLAHDLPRMAQLRATLRERMRQSPLMDTTRFVQNVEAAYRSAWQRWCANGEADIEPGGA